MVAHQIVKGLKKGGTLMSDSDLARIEAYINEVTEPPWENDCLSSIRYVIANYNGTTKSYTYSLGKPQSIDDQDIFDVEWFSQVGYPVPSNDVFNNARYTWRKQSFNFEFEKVIKADKIDYPYFFFWTARPVSEVDEAAAKIILKKVIEITQDDKYNESRLLAEDLLKQF
jgi:hypothetical protein